MKATSKTTVTIGAKIFCPCGICCEMAGKKKTSYEVRVHAQSLQWHHVKVDPECSIDGIWRARGVCDECYNLD